jgi:hypothetical protein
MQSLPQCLVALLLQQRRLPPLRPHQLAVIQRSQEFALVENMAARLPACDGSRSMCLSQRLVAVLHSRLISALTQMVGSQSDELSHNSPSLSLSRTF